MLVILGDKLWHTNLQWWVGRACVCWPVRMRRCLLRLGPAAVDPRGVELLSAHLSVVFLCGAFSPAASPLPTHQLREGADFLAPLPILPHSLRSRGDKHRVKVQAGQRCSFSVSGDFNLFFIPPPSLSRSLHSRDSIVAVGPNGIELETNPQTFCYFWDFFFTFFIPVAAAGSEPRAVRGPTARGETRSAFTFRSARGLHPNIYCTHGVINLPALSSRRCRSCAKAESLQRRWIILTDSFWRIS